MAMLSEADVLKHSMKLRKLDGTPVAPQPEPEKPNEVALALQMCAKSITEMSDMYAALASIMQKMNSSQQNDIAVGAIMKVLKQNGELIETMKNALESRSEERVEGNDEPREWSFIVERDSYGRIKTIKAKEC